MPAGTVTHHPPTPPRVSIVANAEGDGAEITVAGELRFVTDEYGTARRAGEDTPLWNEDHELADVVEHMVALHFGDAS